MKKTKQPRKLALNISSTVLSALASALLSGILSKSGAYGIIRTVNMLFTPDTERNMVAETAKQFTAVWSDLSAIGYAVIWIGLMTMVFGAVMAILQDNIKKMLACSSISQMGYIIMGVGVAAYLGHKGAMGLAGSSYHMLSHALFKSALFLVAGVIACRLGGLDMNKLGGLSRRLPFTTAVAMIAAFGITGIPLFNGYPSKTLLHHAIEKAYHHKDLFFLQIAEWLFVLTSAITVCYFIKFLYLTFFRKPEREYPEIKTESFLMKSGMGILAAAMLLCGLFPQVILHRFILPALNTFMFDPDNIEKHLVGISFWAARDIFAVVIALALGTGLFYLVMKTEFYRLRVPPWLGQEMAGMYVGRVALVGWGYIGLATESMLNLTRTVGSRFLRGSFGLFQSVDYKPGRARIFRTINISNIDFDVFLIMVIFGTVLLFLFFLQFGGDIF